MKTKWSIMTFVAMTLGIPGAFANSITLGDVSQVGGGPSTFTYNYTFANSELRNGNYFTINDFGLVTAHVAPVMPAGSWTLTQAFVGPNSLAATDNAGILNATFTWSGGTVNMGAGSSGPFTFSLTSPLAATHLKLVDYTSVDHIATGPFAGALSKVIGSVAAPTVPDGGATVMLLGAGLAGIGLLRRKLVA